MKAAVLSPFTPICAINRETPSHAKWPAPTGAAFGGGGHLSDLKMREYDLKRRSRRQGRGPSEGVSLRASRRGGRAPKEDGRLPVIQHLRRELEVSRRVTMTISASQNVTQLLLAWAQGNEAARTNLTREADRQGVAPERLIFAPPIPAIEEHLARLSLADLFLDTMPYNSHSTAIDALSAGVPIVTALGNSFASRVAASILTACGMPELVTGSLAEYETLALRLACDAGLLAATRAKLAANRDSSPLFDIARFTRNLEAAYLTIWRRAEVSA